MKSAYIITNSEMTQILKGHLAKLGWNTAGLTLRFTSTNAVVAGISRIEEDCDEPEGFVDEEEDGCETDWDSNLQDGIDEAARGLLSKEPHTVGQLAVALGVAAFAASTAIENLCAEAVAPAREDGRTVSRYMVPGTEAYEQFVAEEKVRVDEQVEKWGFSIVLAVPKFYQRGADRPTIVGTMCESLSVESAEELRRDAKAVFYRMAEAALLDHRGNSWRAGKTEADIANVTSLQGAVREVLMASETGASIQGIAEKLPGFVEHELLRHAVKRMPDVVEQGGLLFHSA
jgi:hypothetical protein